ncbi:ATPase, P type cation/copper-transporter [Thozetella sp. PMI_491]|nr:ATPase, P type cation/copper-transporter [Thozetella sp. PMI_491]
MGPASRSLPKRGDGTVTTSFLLGNLHCPTCVSAIKEVIHQACGDHVHWVSPNVVTSVVTVEHDSAASPSVKEMHSALEDSGFEVCGITTSASAASGAADQDALMITNLENGDSSRGDGGARGPASTFARWASASRATNKSHSVSSQAHLKNCEQCRASKGQQPVDRKEEAVDTPLPHPSRSTPLDDSSMSEEKKISTKSFIAVETELAYPQVWRASLAIGGMTCAACANNISKELYKRDWVVKAAINLVNNSAVVDLSDKRKVDDLVEAIEDLGYEATLDTVIDLAEERAKAQQSTDLWRATLAIGGMTCSACSNAITNEVKKRDWIRSFAVSLVSNSATAEFEGKDNASKLVEAIEDLGYDATIDTVVQLGQEEAEKHERTVEIKIDGLYCEHCPGRVVNSLVGFRRRLEVATQPTHQRPIIKVTYTPDAPDFTVRQILAAIDASDPAFKASIYHPPTLEERSKIIQRKHQKQIFYRVVFTGIVCIPTFIIGIVYMSLIPGHTTSKMFLMSPWTSGISRAQMALFIMATPVYFFAADIFHVRAFKEIRTLWRRGSRVPILQRFYRFGSMNTLMSLGTTIAYISSVSQMIAAAVYQLSSINDSNFYFDSVVFLTFFLLVGRLIESYSKSRAGDAVEMLGKLRPTTAILVKGYGSETIVDEDVVVQADTLDFGDVVRVPHGASPAADGIVVQGESKFDESSLTGESRLVKKVVGDEVFAGTVNKDAAILVKITGTAGQSMLDQIVKVVREGQTRRAPVEQIADLLTTYFVPCVTFIAILTWVIWLSLGFSGNIPTHYLDVTSGGWAAFSLQFAISVFVVACPCGLALAAPTAIFVGGGMAAQHGILAKGGGEAFEKASHIDCVVFDKTGTLTIGGEPSITDSKILAEDGAQKGSILAALKAIEENSSHPIAKAIIAFCKTEGVDRASLEDLQEIPGKGMRATFKDASPVPFDLIIGNEALMADFQVPISSEMTETLQSWKLEAKSVALAAILPLSGPSEGNWTLAAALAISDPIRPEAPAIIRALQSRGTRVWMLSGDNPTTAGAVGSQLGIPADQIIAGVLPTEKAAKITYLQSTLKARLTPATESTTKRALVAMVGDGINDSPALATADVGIAIGSGSDVAISSADFVLVKSDLRAVLTLLDLSTVVFNRIKINFGWALVYNCIAVPVAAGAFYPIMTNGNHVRLDPVWASLAMALSSISVVLSSLALRSRVPFIGFRERRVVV